LVGSGQTGNEGYGEEGLVGSEETGNEGSGEKPRDENTDPIVDSPAAEDLTPDALVLSPWSLQFSVGGNYITKNSITGTPESIAIRETQELNAFTPQVNFGVNYDLNKLRLSTGFSFVQHGENLNYSPVTYDSTFISSFTFVVDTATLDTVFTYFYSTITDTNDVAALANQNNRHSYITVPINFGYSFHVIQNKFTITPKGGVGIRFLVSGSGKYITNNLNGILEERDKPITLVYNSSIEFAYHFGRASIFFAPTYHSTFATFKSLHRYSAIGAKFGVIFKF
ncbi:MAG: hypothetical protein HRT57_05430, partial [Crocinitomicaceae bacterium]|nr:hypothetical protein [Crocinitomicaceae bacterium]